MTTGESRQARRAILRRLSLDDELSHSLPLNLRVAEMTIAIRTNDAPLFGHMVRAFAPFRVAPAMAADARLDLRLDHGADIWQDESAEPRTEEHGRAIAVEHRDFVGLLAVDECRMVVTHPRYVLAVENALRVLVALVLLRHGGLLLHAAGVLREPGATVLFGRSGSGKTTVTRLARGRPLLGDDIVALRRRGGVWSAFATPFGGATSRHRRARSARLVELFRLRHGTSFEIRPIPGARGVADLMQSVVLPAALPEDRRLAFERCSVLQEEVGVRELSFPLDRRLWRWLDGPGV